MSSLSDYRAQRAISQRAFAKSVGVDQSVISRVEKGLITPSLALAAKIERATEGEVPALSWLTQAAEPEARAS